MAEISLERKQEQAKRIIAYMLSKELLPEELVRQTYNNAIGDVVDATRVYADKNPQHKLAFTSLITEIESWMPLPEIDKQSGGKIK